MKDGILQSIKQNSNVSNESRKMTFIYHDIFLENRIGNGKKEKKRKTRKGKKERKKNERNTKERRKGRTKEKERQKERTNERKKKESKKTN